MRTLRGNTTDEVWDNLQRLKAAWGYSRTMQAVEVCILEAAQRHLGGSTVEQNRQRAFQVLSRLKPGGLCGIVPDDIESVTISPKQGTVSIQVWGVNQPITVTARQWEQ